MELTEYHRKRNERALKSLSEQPHVTQQEAIEQTKRLMLLADQPDPQMQENSGTE